MSEILAVGPALDLLGPRPVAPPYSLLNTPGVVVDRDGGRWLNGVNIYGYPDDTPSLWEPCSDGTFRTKSEGTAVPSARFDSLVVYVPITCTAADWADLAERAEAVLEATESMGVEEALAAGVPQSSNPFFGDANVTVLNSGTAVTPAIGFAYLEDAIGQTGREGMIHSTPAVLSRVDAFKDKAGGMRTINGNRVVSGDGYIGVDTPFLTNPSYDLEAGNTEAWIFATGPVEVRLGPVQITTLRESLDRSDNTVTFRAERYFVASWDTALQAAVLVDWST